MTPDEMNEHRHIYETRLAILEASNPPSALHHNMAVIEADNHIAELQRAQRQDAVNKLRKLRESL